MAEGASATITAGETETTASLTVADDGVDGRSETLALLAVIAAGDEVGSLAFTVWDASVPGVPPAALLLLGAGVVAGGCRRRRKKATA